MSIKPLFVLFLFIVCNTLIAVFLKIHYIAAGQIKISPTVIWSGIS